MTDANNDPAEPLTKSEPLSDAEEAKKARRARSLRTSIIGISISVGLCVILGLISLFVPADSSAGFMFASYGAGYVAFMWALYTGYQHFMGPNAAK
jgi:hypothetical protein